MVSDFRSLVSSKIVSQASSQTRTALLQLLKTSAILSILFDCLSSERNAIGEQKSDTTIQSAASPTAAVTTSTATSATIKILAIADDFLSGLLLASDEISTQPPSALLRVDATDGINTGSAISIPFEVPKKAPSTIVINSPANGAIQQAANPVHLSGAAYGVDDGLLTGKSLVWTDSKAGALGAALTQVRYSFNGGATYTLIPLKSLPYTLAIPGTGTVNVVALALDASGQASAQSAELNLSAGCVATPKISLWGALTLQLKPSP